MVSESRGQETDDDAAPSEQQTSFQAVELWPGDVVEISGLKAAADLNGQQGTLSKFDEGSGRWQVRLSDGTVKALRPESLAFRGIGPVEDDGTPMLVGMATQNATIHKFVKFLEDCLPQASESFQLAGHVFSPSCGGCAKGKDADIWLKLARQAQQKLMGLLEDMQKHIEATDCIDLSRLLGQAKDDLKMARKDLIRFVQGVQERLESVLKRLLLAVRRLASEVPDEKPAKQGLSAEDVPLHEKYRDVFVNQTSAQKVVADPEGPSITADVPEGQNACELRPAAPRGPSAGEEVLAEKNADNMPAPREDAPATATKLSLKPIIVKYQGKGEKPPPSDNLYVKDLPGWTSEADITAIFSTVGEVQSMKLKNADWGAICFVRLKDKKEAANAIQRLHGTVPDRLTKRAAEQEAKRLDDAIARVRLQSVVKQLEKGVIFTVDLSRPLGITFNDALRATSVQQGSQAEDLGVCSGWKARSIGGDALESTAGLVAKLQALKKDGVKQASVAFSPPPFVVTFDERPFGIVIKKDPEFGLIVVSEVKEPAVSKGVRPGAVLARIERQDVSSMSEAEVADLLRNATFPVTLFFEQAHTSKPKSKQTARANIHADSNEAAGDGETPTGAWRLTQGLPMTVTLSEPLGIFFDDILVVKDVEENSQAARLGITAGWRARSVAGESLKTTDSFVAAVQALKAKGTPSVHMAFSPPPLAVKFDARPFGFTVQLDDKLSLYTVGEASGSAAQAGVKSGMAIARVSGADACSLSQMKLIRTLQQTPLPASMIFETVHIDTAEDSKLKRPESDSKMIAFELSQPLGISFDKECCAKGVQENSQAAKAGVAEGWRALAVEAIAVKTTKELVGQIKILKERGLTSAQLSFSCPPSSINGSEVQPSVECTETIDDIKRGMTRGREETVHVACDEQPVKLSRQEAGTPARENVPKIIGLDLSQPLGIFFDKECCAKGVQEDSQAAKAGISEGWRALAVEDVSVKTTKELVQEIKVLKEKGMTNARVSFFCPLGVCSGYAEQQLAAHGESHMKEEVPKKLRSEDDDSMRKDEEKREREDRMDAETKTTPQELPLAANKPVDPSGQESGTSPLGQSRQSVVFDLAKPLGINFDARLVAKGVQDGSQAAEAGITGGWQALSVSDESVQTTKELVARIKALKANGAKEVVVAFLAPCTKSLDTQLLQGLSAQISQLEQPLEVDLGRSQSAECSTQSTLECGSQSKQASISTLGAPTDEGPIDGDTELRSPEFKSITFDLAQPLGINFDAKLVVKSVQDGSQAASAGVCIGLRALSLGEHPVQTTKELVAKVKALKADGVKHVVVAFLVDSSSNTKRSNSVLAECGAEHCQDPPSKRIKTS